MSKSITQASHGFAVGDVIYYTGSAYAKAKADAVATSEVLGMVSSIDGNDFILTLGGEITGLTSLSAGVVYYLSGDTAGSITALEPTTEGYISKPIFITTSTTSGFFFNMRGAEITDTSTSYYRAFVNGDLAAGVLTVTHNFGHKYVNVQVYDNSDKLVIPDDVTLSSTSALAIDLSSYGTISGTWHALVLDLGAQLSMSIVDNFLAIQVFS